jgi:acetolactate synthase-1/3 small subunit
MLEAPLPRLYSPLERTFVAHVEDRPGALNRVASLFRRRGFNIESLTVGHTERPGVSRMTIVTCVDEPMARCLEANLYKLVNVLYVEEVTHIPSVTRDLALIKVRADSDIRVHVLQICEVFRAHVVDVAPDALILEITGTEDKIQSLVEVLRPFGILEMVCTGRVAMTRGAKGPSTSAAETAEDGPGAAPA